MEYAGHPCTTLSEKCRMLAQKILTQRPQVPQSFIPGAVSFLHYSSQVSVKHAHWQSFFSQHLQTYSPRERQCLHWGWLTLFYEELSYKNLFPHLNPQAQTFRSVQTHSPTFLFQYPQPHSSQLSFPFFSPEQFQYPSWQCRGCICIL